MLRVNGNMRFRRCCSCLSAAKTLLRAPRTSKSCISIDKQYSLFRQRPCWPSKSSRSVVFRETRWGKLKRSSFSSFLHRREAFHWRSIGYISCWSRRGKLSVTERVSLRGSTPLTKTPFFGGRLRGNTHLENTGFRIHVLRNLIGQFESADD